MGDRTGQLWEENNVLFVVVGPPIHNEHWTRHPVCILTNEHTPVDDGTPAFVDEGEISWETLPYMCRIS